MQQFEPMVADDARKSAFFGVFVQEGFNWDSLQRFIAGYQPPTKPFARQVRDLRAFAKRAGYRVVGAWKETASGAKQEGAERKKVLGLAQPPRST
jgi:hypothetical protein